MHGNTPLKRNLYYGTSLSFFAVLGISFNKPSADGERKFESKMNLGILDQTQVDSSPKFH